ncbi:NfeD family protein [Thermohalobacter berrensis]|uniref:NfeD family protein n=1 Tax=Thermohalobacter berrensis TaxID=99594 RepID=UPI000E75FCB3|nr:NfeD family protein [Thermohalobacter berrensis]
MDWWNGITGFEKIFWYFAIPFSLAFIVQVVLTFMGMDGDVDVFDAFLDFDSFPLFTVRNFIIFFTVFGWTGIAAINAGFSKTVTLILAIFLALILMLIVAGTFYFMNRLTESGNMDLTNAINRIGEVYIKIPANRKGRGKVHIEIQGSLREIEAVTDGEELKSGEMVKVVKVLNDQLLLVEKVDK